MKYIQARISDELHQAIKLLSVKDKLTMPEEIVIMLSTAVKEREENGKRED